MHTGRTHTQRLLSLCLLWPVHVALRQFDLPADYLLIWLEKPLIFFDDHDNQTMAMNHRFVGRQRIGRINLMKLIRRTKNDSKRLLNGRKFVSKGKREIVHCAPRNCLIVPEKIVYALLFIPSTWTFLPFTVALHTFAGSSFLLFLLFPAFFMQNEVQGRRRASIFCCHTPRGVVLDDYHLHTYTHLPSQQTTPVPFFSLFRAKGQFLKAD